MDKTIPASAALLLDYIGDTEAPQGYVTIYGNNHGKLPAPITTMTLDEINAAQRSWTRRFGSSATGRYQFMRATLTGLKKELGLTGREKLDANLQDRLAFHLLKRRGYEAFMAGTIDQKEFGKRLAQEWASFPVLGDCDGDKRKIKRGQSYYAGDGVNKALVKPAEVERVLTQMKGLDIGTAAVAEALAPKPVPKPQKPRVVKAPAPPPVTRPVEVTPTGEVVLGKPRKTKLLIVVGMVAAFAIAGLAAASL